MIKSKFYNIENTNITLKKCPPEAKIKVYYEVKDKRGKPVNKPKKEKKTLSQRMDQLEASINKLAKTVDVGFKQVNNRIDNIDARLDYIVKANDLKDLPNRK